jgi:hypothetical protein
MLRSVFNRLIVCLSYAMSFFLSRDPLRNRRTDFIR